VPEDPGAKESAHEAAGISTTKAEEDARSGGLLFVLTIYAASRLFYLGAGTMFAGNLPAGGFYWLTPDVPPGTLNIWAHWDGAWYSQIAAEGYHTVASTAFFPLYPLLMRSFAELFGGPLSLPALSVWGVLLSLLALPFAFYFVYKIAESGWGERTARTAVLSLAVFPTSFFFNAVYTESLFLALSAGSIWALRVRRDLLLACALATFATATRNVGIFLLVPLAYEWLRGEAGREEWWGEGGGLSGVGALGSPGVRGVPVVAVRRSLPVLHRAEPLGPGSNRPTGLA